MNRMQRVVSDDGGAVRAAPDDVVAEGPIEAVGIGGVDAGLQLPDEVVDGIARGPGPVRIVGQIRSADLS